MARLQMIKGWTDSLTPIDENGNEILQSPPSMSGTAESSEVDGDEYEGGLASYAIAFAIATAVTYAAIKALKKENA